MGKASDAAPVKVGDSVQQLASKIGNAKCTRPGDIVLRLSGRGGATYRLSPGPKEVEVSETAAVTDRPLIEVIGDAETIQAVLDGKADARESFLAGGIRVRGDLQYLSDGLVELGILKHGL